MTLLLLLMVLLLLNLVSENRRHTHAVTNLNDGWRPSGHLPRETNEEEKPALILKFEEEHTSLSGRCGIAFYYSRITIDPLPFTPKVGVFTCQHHQRSRNIVRVGVSLFVFVLNTVGVMWVR